VREPYLAQLRAEVTELKLLLDNDPNEIIVTRAWNSLAKIKNALGALCPNHPAIMQYR
jgi:hypothetical protein